MYFLKSSLTCVLKDGERVFRTKNFDSGQIFTTYPSHALRRPFRPPPFDAALISASDCCLQHFVRATTLITAACAPPPISPLPRPAKCASAVKIWSETFSACYCHNITSYHIFGRREWNKRDRLRDGVKTPHKVIFWKAQMGHQSKDPHFFYFLNQKIITKSLF